jgi:hypothetical protein
MGLFRKPQEEQQREPVVDLRDAKPTLQFGFPTPCPECGAPGYLDSIDVTRRVMHQHCPTCFAKWQTTEDELIHTQ